VSPAKIEGREEKCEGEIGIKIEGERERERGSGGIADANGAITKPTEIYIHDLTAKSGATGDAQYYVH